MILGLEFFGTTWIIIGIIIAIILLFLIGIVSTNSTYDDIIENVFLAIAAAALWPFVLSIIFFIMVVAIPISLGKVFKNSLDKKTNKNTEKEDFLKQVNKMIKKGGH